MTFTRIPPGMERRHSGIYAPRRAERLTHPGGLSNEEIRALIRGNPWHDPDLERKRNGNAPDTLRGLVPDFGGIIAPPKNSLGYQETLTAATTSGPVKNTFTTAVTALNPTNIIAFAQNYFKNDGQVFRITALAAVSNIVTTPGTMTMELRMGPTSTIVAFTTGALQLNATAHTLLPAKFEAWLTMRAIGSGTSANFMGMGEVRGIMFTLTAAQVDAPNTYGSLSAPATAPAVGTGFDSTVVNLFDFFVGMSISNAGNGITVHQYIVESLN